MRVEPRATYRVQLSAEFDFQAAGALADHLAALGVSHLYVSPITQATAGSTHGYDVVDPGRVSDELGGRAGLDALVAALAERSLGLLVDIVPNHRAADPADAEWWALLRFGRGGPGDPVFDVEWDAPGSRGRVVLPVLQAPLGPVLGEGAADVGRHPVLGRVLRVGGTTVPLAPGSEDVTDLRELLERQHYELVPWREAPRRVNFRRFFDIASLPAVRTEDPAVFAQQHELVVDLLAAHVVDGLRVDHVDGLRDPHRYLTRLRELGVDWVVVEKILASGEPVPAGLDADGTTGYEFADRVGGLLVDPAGEAPLTALWTEVSGDRRPFAAIEEEARAWVLDHLYAADVGRLLRACEAAGCRHPARRAALAALVAGVEVYRTYLPVAGPAPPDGGTHGVAAADVAVLERAFERAAASGVATDALDELRAVLLEPSDPDRVEALARFQQLTPAVAAKGVEDTALYRYLRLLARNEVGADPGRFAWSPEEFHAANAEAARRAGRGLNALSTHDTKLSGDVRARLAVLSEVPAEWRRLVHRCASRLVHVWGDVARDPIAEYHVLQATVGAWPIDGGRLRGYATKAARERKVRTSWFDVDTAYEGALDRLVDVVLDDDDVRRDVEELVARVLEPGRVNALTQVLLQCAAPGIPDVYQGDELWNLRLVDPDNRAALDVAKLGDVVASLRREARVPGRDALRDPADPGRPKLWTLLRALDLRHRRPEVFRAGSSYAPLAAAGEAAEHVVACMRGGSVVAVVPRLTVGLTWGATLLELPRGTWHDVITGATHSGGASPVGELTEAFPVALLERTG